MKKLALGCLALALVFPIVAGVGFAAMVMMAGIIGDEQGSSSWCAPTTSGTSTPAPVGDILAAGERSSAGMNASVIAVFAADLASGMQSPGRVTATGDTPAGVFAQTAANFPADAAPAFGTVRDPRANVKTAASTWLTAFVRLLRAGGAGSPYESAEAIRAAVLAIGAPGDGGRLFSRWKQADITTAMNTAAAARAALTLVNAVTGSAGGPVATAPAATVSAAATSWARTRGWLAPMLDARTGAASAGRSVFVIGDDTITTVGDDLGDAGYVVQTRSRWTADALAATLQTPRAQSADAWVLAPFGDRRVKASEVPGVIAAVRAVQGTRQVFWLTPWRIVDIAAQGRPTALDNPAAADRADGDATDGEDGPSILAQAVQANASAGGAHVLDWAAMASANPDWFAPNDPRPSAAGQDALVMLIASAAGTAGVADAVIGNCEDDALTRTSIDASQAVVLDGPSGRFVDGPPVGSTAVGGGAARTATMRADQHVNAAAVALRRAQTAALTTGNPTARTDLANAQAAYRQAVLTLASARGAGGYTTSEQPTWVIRALARAQRALVDPPCDDNPTDSKYGCDGMCAQLAARIFGQSNGFYRPGTKTWAYSMWLALSGGASPDVARIGSGREFAPPVGAMLFWYMGRNHPGHVAVYIGGGNVVTNYRDSRVVQMPAQRLVDEYAGYVGWALPPTTWQK